MRPGAAVHQTAASWARSGAAGRPAAVGVCSPAWRRQRGVAMLINWAQGRCRICCTDPAGRRRRPGRKPWEARRNWWEPCANWVVAARTRLRCCCQGTMGTKARRVDRLDLGLKNEYGVTCTFRGSGGCRRRGGASPLRRVGSWGRSRRLPRKGARLHPTWAATRSTPRRSHVLDPAAHDKAGERSLEGLARRRRPVNPRGGYRRDIHMVEEQHRLRGNSYGGHENYLEWLGGPVRPTRPTSRSHSWSPGRSSVVRGRLRRRPRARCTASASGPSISCRARTATTRSRPMINTRDQRHRPTPSASLAARDRR